MYSQNQVLICKITTPRMRCVIDSPKIECRLSFSVTRGMDVKPYEGEYEVTPTRETQVLYTANKGLEQDIVVNPIPRNYGLITYNGFGITVS